MNKAYEFIGSLEYRPLNKDERQERAEMYKEHGYLPPNVIPDMDKYPVLHLIHYLEHPYKNATQFLIDAVDLENEKIKELRGKIFNILVDIYGGDELAAEYVLFTLLSKVQTREDGIPLGICCTNLYASDEDTTLQILKGTEKFMKLMTQHTLVAQTDLDSLNQYDMTPVKNYDTNRLSQGALQFLNSTVILFDETQMKEGKSEGDRAIKNMQAIASLIEEQKVRYNFQYHSQDFDCSAAVLIVSCGRSIFKNAYPLPVFTTRTPNPDAVNDIDPDLLDEFRLFFNQVSRKGAMTIPEEVNEHIQSKYVEARQEQKEGESTIGANTLHRWLTLGKLKVSSHGMDSLDVDIVDHVIEMENAREKRVAEILANN